MNDKGNKNEIFEQYSEQELLLLKESIECSLVAFSEVKELSNAFDLNDLRPLIRLNKELSEVLFNPFEPDKEKEVSNE